MKSLTASEWYAATWGRAATVASLHRNAGPSPSACCPNKGTCPRGRSLGATARRAGQVGSTLSLCHLGLPASRGGARGLRPSPTRGTAPHLGHEGDAAPSSCGRLIQATPPNRGLAPSETRKPRPREVDSLRCPQGSPPSTAQRVAGPARACQRRAMLDPGRRAGGARAGHPADSPLTASLSRPLAASCPAWLSGPPAPTRGRARRPDSQSAG